MEDPINGESMTEQKIRVLIAKPGLDGHDRGAKVVARALRDAGMEVIYTGLRQTQVVGLSILSGAHLALVPRIVDLLRANGQKDILIFVGGIIPEEDVPELLKMGVHAVYGPGTPTGKIIEEIRGSFSKELA
jgi:methylmalonyl-CoA mutase C-terminal domain/subunit